MTNIKTRVSHPKQTHWTPVTFISKETEIRECKTCVTPKFRGWHIILLAHETRNVSTPVCLRMKRDQTSIIRKITYVRSENKYYVVSLHTTWHSPYENTLTRYLILENPTTFILTVVRIPYAIHTTKSFLIILRALYELYTSRKIILLCRYPRTYKTYVRRTHVLKYHITYHF